MSQTPRADPPKLWSKTPHEPEWAGARKNGARGEPNRCLKCGATDTNLFVEPHPMHQAWSFLHPPTLIRRVIKNPDFEVRLGGAQPTTIVIDDPLNRGGYREKP